MRGRARPTGAVAGFTLLEMALAMALIGIIGLGASSLMVLAAESQAFALDLGDAADAGSLASDLITTDVRGLRVPTAIGLLSMQANEVDIVHVNGRRIRYSLSGTDLVRQEAISVAANLGPARIVARNATQLAVSYRDQFGATTGLAAMVRRIDISVQVTRGAVVRTFGGQIFPRSSDSLGADWREE